MGRRLGLMVGATVLLATSGCTTADDLDPPDDVKVVVVPYRGGELQCRATPVYGSNPAYDCDFAGFHLGEKPDAALERASAEAVSERTVAYKGGTLRCLLFKQYGAATTTCDYVDFHRTKK